MKELGEYPKQLVLNYQKREVNTAPIVKNNKHLEKAVHQQCSSQKT